VCSPHSFEVAVWTASSKRSSISFHRALAKPFRASESGQATVELALCLPIVALLIAITLEFAALGLDRSRLWQAARESARAAAVDADPGAVKEVLEAAGLGDVTYEIIPPPAERVQGEPVEVVLRFEPTSSVPLVGALFEEMVLEASASMRLERP
jgi:hypothetical protein